MKATFTQYSNLPKILILDVTQKSHNWKNLRTTYQMKHTSTTSSQTSKALALNNSTLKWTTITQHAIFFKNKTTAFQLDNIPSKPIPPSKTANIQDINTHINTLTAYVANIESLTNLHMEK